MELTLNQEGDRARFEINGEIDEKGAELLKERFYQLKLSSLKEVVLDFKDVNHIGSAGIGKLLLFYKNLAVGEGSLRILNLNKPTYNLFKELKLNTIFSISMINTSQILLC